MCRCGWGCHSAKGNDDNARDSGDGNETVGGSEDSEVIWKGAGTVGNSSPTGGSCQGEAQLQESAERQEALMEEMVSNTKSLRMQWTCSCGQTLLRVREMGKAGRAGGNRVVSGGTGKGWGRGKERAEMNPEVVPEVVLEGVAEVVLEASMDVEMTFSR